MLLETLSTIFKRLHLHVNASKGKKEALLQYRGTHGAACREARRDADGRLVLAMPNRPLKVAVVESYKHLGTYTSRRTASMADASQKSSKTRAAYAPLSYTIFGSALVHNPNKLLFAKCCLFAKLLHGVQVLVPTV